MEIQSERHGQILVISLVGSFDALTAGQAQHHIDEQTDAGQRRIVLDLGDVDFMSSSGVRVVLKVLKKSRGLSGDIRLAAAQPGIQRTLEISGLLRVLEAHPTVEEAVRSFSLMEP